MTRDHHQQRRVVPRAPRRAGALAVSVIAIVGLSSFGNGADAARRTKSAVIADAAGQAVEALDEWEQTLNPVDYVRFVQHRDQAAAMTEEDIEVAPGTLHDAWSGVSLAKQQALLNAVSQLGVPYRSLASKPGVGFDCSGLTVWAFAEADVEIPRISRDQINDADAVDRDEAVAGDLVYYPGHVSIYLGADLMVHSPNSGSHVEVTWLPERSLRFGDATPDDAADAADAGSLVDGAVAVSE